MEAPELYYLARIRWQVWAGFSFVGVTPPVERIRVSMWFAALRAVTDELGLHFPSLLWVLRQEKGEATHREHFHALIAGFPEQMVNIGTCFFIQKTWAAVGGGKAPVHLFDRSLAGIDYVCKCLGEVDEATLAGQIYESNKFGSGSCELMLSDSLKKCLASESRLGERRLRRVKRKAFGKFSIPTVQASSTRVLGPTVEECAHGQREAFFSARAGAAKFSS